MSLLGHCSHCAEDFGSLLGKWSRKTAPLEERVVTALNWLFSRGHNPEVFHLTPSRIETIEHNLGCKVWRHPGTQYLRFACHSGYVRIEPKK